MGWADPDGFLTKLFSGDPIAILISFIVTITLPTLLHWYFYTTSAKAALAPTFLLLGPSGSGKTSLVSLLQRSFPNKENAESSPTRTSQIASTVSLLLPTNVPLGSNKYRSVNDFETVDAAKHATKYLITDTPGHGKLRNEEALSHLSNPAVRGVIFVVDSTAVDSADSQATRDAASYLHDILLILQKKKTSKSAVKTNIPVLIAANKQDLFTALPAGAIRERLQSEVEKVRKSKSKGISTVDSDPEADDENDVLGGGGEERFTFKLMEEEYDIGIDVVGGAVRGEEAGKGVRKWEEWIGGCL